MNRNIPSFIIKYNRWQRTHQVWKKAMKTNSHFAFQENENFTEINIKAIYDTRLVKD